MPHNHLYLSLSKKFTPSNIKALSKIHSRRIIHMQNQFNETFLLFKKFIADSSQGMFTKKPKIDVSEEKKVHVKLVAALTKITRLIDTQPAVMKACEEARFVVSTAPLGTVPAGQKILIKALHQLEVVQEQEPQIRYTLKQLKPLIQQYLQLSH